MHLQWMSMGQRIFMLALLISIVCAAVGAFVVVCFLIDARQNIIFAQIKPKYSYEKTVYNKTVVGKVFIQILKVICLTFTQH